jgi:STE24 endopeptidase
MSEITPTRMTGVVWRIATITVLAGLWLLGASLLWRTRVPADLDLPALDPRNYFSARELDRTADYERFLRVNLVLSLLASLVALVVLTRRAPRLAREVGLGPIGAGLIIGMVTLVTLWFVDLPFSIAAEWWQRRHDQAHGSWIEWLLNPWAGLLTLVGLVALQIVIVMAFARRFQRHWWVPVTPIFVALTGLFLLLSPYWLAFGVDSPRSSGLRRDVRTLADRLDVEGTPVDVEKVSDLTTQANALALGLGPTTRVVLFDTLLDGRFPRGEVRVVLAHEFGHVSRDHLWKGLAWFALFAVPGVFAIAELTRLRGGLADPGVLPFGMLVFVLLQLLLAPAANVVSRRYEAEADWVALQATRDPTSARRLFQRFSRTNLGQPEPPTWSFVLFETHPSLMQRIAMAREWARLRGRGALASAPPRSGGAFHTLGSIRAPAARFGSLG